MSMHNTALRFEVDRSSNSLKKCLAREKEYVEGAENAVKLVKQAKRDFIHHKMTEWCNDCYLLEKKNALRQCRLDINFEIEHAKNSLSAVRKKALNDILEKDCDIFGKELKQIGKIFYVKRI